MPSSKDVRAEKPSSRSARLVSRTLRCSSPSLRRVEDRLDVDAGDAPADVEEVEHGGGDPRADVEDARRPLQRGQRHRSDVADVDVVPLLRAVAEDVRRLPAREPPEEDGDDTRLAVRVLARPEDVAVAERRVLAPVEAVVGREVLLPRELRGSVLRERRAGRRLRGGLGALAVDRARPSRRRRCASRARAPPRAGGSSRARSPRRRSPGVRPRRARRPARPGAGTPPASPRRRPRRPPRRRGCRRPRARRRGSRSRASRGRGRRGRRPRRRARPAHRRCASR